MAEHICQRGHLPVCVCVVRRVVGVWCVWMHMSVPLPLSPLGPATRTATRCTSPWNASPPSGASRTAPPPSRPSRPTWRTAASSANSSRSVLTLGPFQRHRLGIPEDLQGPELVAAPMSTVVPYRVKNDAK